jgi:hypothetical protein
MRALTLFIILAMVAVWSASAQSATVLRNVGPIAVVIQDMDPDAVREDFTVDLIRTDIEVELRKAGIRVVDRAQLDDSSGKPYLFLVINTLKGTLNTYTYSMELRFHQNASLTRNPDVTLSVSTWNRSVIGSERGNRLPLLRDKIKEMLMPFINEYLAANPR